MSLDRELQTMLTERAELADAPAPDLRALRVGGRVIRRRDRRTTLVAAVAAVVTVVAVVAGGVAAWHAQTVGGSEGVTNDPDRTEPGSAPYVSPPLYFLDLITGALTPAKGFSTNADYAFSPDRSRVACTGQCFGKTGPLVVADVDGSDPVRLHVPSAEDRTQNTFVAEPAGLTWSPDGTKLLYTVGRTPYPNLPDLILHDVARDEATVLVDFGPRDWADTGLGGFDFSPDGSTVLYSRPRMPAPCIDLNQEFPCAERTDFDLWTVPSGGGEPTMVLRNAGLPRYLADGQEIAFVEVGTNHVNGGSISVVADGFRRKLTSTPTDLWAIKMSPDRSRFLYLTARTGIYVVDAATGGTSRVYGNSAAWVGNDRLLVGCTPGAPAPAEEPTVDGCS
ncbi:hypothetical protein EKO23_19550 [Nocardioides guangzhouensis]|uniref:Dipeptidylpeptidase IV N-terminal domain-containing protein n=1 Tax=Nocardioides guangzhouensis TaxID=2497878 RepID=A0A4Q4Z7W7_9ACTN|nr:PD40 domain-containing protein [Nocardioides guangzhouensis]RYP83261.1 hypothetical protein EKO23_19550 [Nocardioides guangzhouensis]